MISFLVTVSIFPLIGYAATAAFRLALPPTIAGRLATLFLYGLGVNGSLLYFVGLGIPLSRAVFAALPVAALIVALWRRRAVTSRVWQRRGKMIFPNILLGVRWPHGFSRRRFFRCETMTAA